MARSRKPFHELSPAYQKRILSAEKRGKTRAEARGHKPPPGKTEHQVRKERTQKKYGVSPSQVARVRAMLAVSTNPDERRVERFSELAKRYPRSADAFIGILTERKEEAARGRRISRDSYIAQFDDIEGFDILEPEDVYYN